MTIGQPSADDDCALLHQLRAAPGLLQDVAASDEGEFRLQERLRKLYPDSLVRAALSLVELREKAAARFSRAAEMWFDRKGFEQSTGEIVARHKAQRFEGRVWDLCCGIGGDALALAGQCDVIAVDSNPAACLRTAWNVQVYGGLSRLETRVADVHELGSLEGLVHIDPDRRGRSSDKTVRVEDYVPSAAFLREALSHWRGGAIKLSPASNFGGKFDDVEHELISLHGECKEATIWFGRLKGSAPWRATVLPSGATLAGHPLDSLAPRSGVRRFVFDPDPAIVRSGLVDCAAEHLGLSRLDDAEEYLTGDACPESPFVRGFEVLETLPHSLKELKACFRKSDFGQLEIKCRHLHVNVESIRRALPLPGDRAGVLIFARVQGKARALVCRRV